MEEKLCSIQPTEKTILHKTLCGRMPRIPLKMGQTPISEPIGNSLTTQSLLPHTGDHLTQVDIRPFGATQKHLERSIIGG